MSNSNQTFIGGSDVYTYSKVLVLLYTSETLAAQRGFCCGRSVANVCVWTTIMPTHLLHLPKELLENILVLICQDNAQTIQTCRQTCRTLKTIITQCTLVQYLERLTLLGMHDPQLLIGDGGSVIVSPSATLALPDRMASLQAWEEAWNPLGASGAKGVFGPSAVPTYASRCLLQVGSRCRRLQERRVCGLRF